MQTTLREYAAHHLMEKAWAGKVTTVWLESTEDRLRAAVEFFADRELSTITTRDVQRWTACGPSPRGGGSGAGRTLPAR